MFLPRVASAAVLASFSAAPWLRAEDVLSKSAAESTRQFCFDCHSGKEAEAGVDLESLLGQSPVPTFKNWQKVVALVEQRKIPPPDAPQPTDDQRGQLAGQL